MVQQWLTRVVVAASAVCPFVLFSAAEVKHQFNRHKMQVSFVLNPSFQAPGALSDDELRSCEELSDSEEDEEGDVAIAGMLMEGIVHGQVQQVPVFFKDLKLVDPQEAQCGGLWFASDDEGADSADEHIGGVQDLQKSAAAIALYSLKDT